MSETIETTVVTAVPAKKSKAVLIITLAFVLCSGAAAGVLLMNRHKSVEKKPAEPEVKTVLHLDTFVVNVGAPEQSGYLRVGVDLGLAGEEKGGEGKESTLPTALVRDTILAVLTSAKPDELVSQEGKTKLKEAILQALRARAPQLNVHEVYYTEFLLQR